MYIYIDIMKEDNIPQYNGKVETEQRLQTIQYATLKLPNAMYNFLFMTDSERLSKGESVSACVLADSAYVLVDSAYVLADW